MNLENIHKLVEYKIIENPFDYQDLDDEGATKYKHFEHEFKRLYLDKVNQYNLKDCFFYIRDDLSCNAFARNYKGYNIIGITHGYAVQMFEVFEDKYFPSLLLRLAFVNVEEESVAYGYAGLHEINDFKVDKFMLACSTQFTFGHEFQHILQLNSLNNSIDNYLGENLDKSSKFNIIRHAWELDADWFAMWEVLKYIFEIKHQYKIKDDNIFKCLLLLGLGSVCITKTLSYFGAKDFQKEKKIDKLEFYTKAHSHPHPLVRILNMIDCFYAQIVDTFPSLKIEKQTLLNSTLVTVKFYVNSFTPNNTIIMDIFKDMDLFLETANSYKDELYDIGINDNAIRTLLIKRGINFEQGN